MSYFANGNDVDTVIINGEGLMVNRVVKTIDETEVLRSAQRAIDAALDRTKLHHLLTIPELFWEVSKGIN